MRQLKYVIDFVVSAINSRDQISSGENAAQIRAPSKLVHSPIS
jgi:hypothetical protein